MIDRLKRFSRRLLFLTPIVIILMIIALFGVVYSLVNINTELSERYLMPSIVVLLWASSLYCIIKLFPDVPTAALADQKFFTRLKIKIQRLFYRVLGLVFLVVSFVALYISVQLLKIWVMGSP